MTVTPKQIEDLTTAINRLASQTGAGGVSGQRDQGSIASDFGGGGTSGGSFGGATRKVYNEIVGNLANMTQMQNAQALQNQVQSFVDPNGPIPMIIKLQEEFGNLAGGMGEQLTEGTAVSNKYGEAMFQLNEKLLGSASSVDGMGVSLSNMLGDFPEAIKAFDELASGAMSSASGFKLLRDSSAEDLSDMALEMGVFGTRMGLSTRETAKIVERQLSLTGKAGTDMLREAAVAASRVAAQTGDSSKEIMNITAELIADTKRYGNVSVQEAARIGASLRQLGLDYGELGGMVDKFFNFDSSVQSVSALTSVFGVQLDAMEMMMMANEDQGAMMEYVRDQFIATGKSVDDMTLAEKRLVQQQLGLSDIQAVERLFDPDADFAAMDELGTDAELKAGDVKDSMEELSADIRKFGGDTQNAIDRISDQAFKSALATQQRTLAKSTSLLQEFYTEAERAAVQSADEVGDILGVSKIEKSLDEALTKFTVGFKEGITEALKDLPAEFKRVFEKAAEEANVKSESPSDYGRMITGGITDAFAAIPDAFKDQFDSASPEVQQTFDKMVEDSESTIGKFASQIRSLGVEFNDLSENEREALMEKYSLSERNLQKILNQKSLQNVEERNQAQKLEQALKEAAEVHGGTGTQAFMENAERIRQNMKLSEDSMKAVLADLDPEGISGTQDAAFKAFQEAKQKAEEEKKAEAEGENATEVDESTAQEGTSGELSENARQNARERDAKVVALTQELKELKEQMAEARTNGAMTVKIVADPLVLNLMDGEVAKMVARSAIHGTRVMDAREGPQDSRLELTNVNTPAGGE